MSDESNRSEEVKRVFNENAMQYFQMFGDSISMKPAIQRFSEYLTNDQPRILDLGCGPGNLSVAIKKLHRKSLITAVDFAPEMCTLAQKQVPDALVLVHDVRQIHQLELPVYDGILCGFCIPYLTPEDVAALLSYASAQLAPNGLLWLSFIENSPDNSGYIKPSSGKGKGIFTHFYERDHIIRSLNSRELVVLHCLDTVSENPSSYDPSHHRDVTIIAQKNAPEGA